MLFYLLWHCDLEPDVKTANPIVLTKKSFVMLPDKDFWLKLRARESKIPVTQGISNGHGVEGQ
ncbi:Uncharacterized protein DBV15_13026 [Temnothorax longispinosus]|uniref:Uncharacterized protein n=1 Tax=Temnothorax longispinosus TaxID=300112 RepID=A0A4S2KP53_9HYME|nr:Uncharacterized protein DBV15_13026 [Temnothorax longispinosus]